MTKELNLRTKNPDRYVRTGQHALTSYSDGRPPKLILNPVGHHTRLLYYICASPATNYDTDPLLWAAHLACDHYAMLGRDDDRFRFC